MSEPDCQSIKNSNPVSHQDSLMTNMSGRFFLPTVLLLLTYGFWVSPELQVITAGVVIFLLGMVYLEKGFKVFTGGFLEALLQKTTDRLWKSLTFGITTTAVLQSSSLVSVIIISFLSAGLIGLTAGVGIIFGANLGSTLGAWLVAIYGMKIKLASYAMPLLVFGLILRTRQEKNFSGLGYILLGIGFLFLGVDYMKEGFEAFQNVIDFSSFSMEGWRGIVVYILFGMLATIIMQSTNATMILAFSALVAGQLTYDNALCLVIGSNVGTTITAVLGAVGGNAAGKRLAVAHIIFNVLTAALAILLLPQLKVLVDIIAQWLLINEDDYTLKLALFHTIFNVLGILVLLPFIKLLIRWLETLFVDPARQCHLNLANEEYAEIDRARYLTPAVLSYPDTALRALTKECDHLYRNTLELICYGIYLSGDRLREADNLTELVNNWVRDEQPWTIKELYIRHIKGVYADIIHYSGAIEGNLPRQQAQELFGLKVACRDFVRAIKNVKHIYKNMGLYLHSDNEQMRHQYNQLRLCLASVLKLVDLLGVRRNYDHIRQHAEQLKQELREQDEQMHKTLNELIRSNQVDSFMASSLMNDSAHVHDACTNLIDGAVIMLTRDREEYREIDLNFDTRPNPDKSR
ncbi:Na/Pi cotransporter family protein [Endozoicomonas sp.]|uniref:Na/Pi cotransporter family protein n=1 Tax=Endozoicomonas sp. TaxID=1892382 RepID=UPI0028837EF5|nr:Na/Pi symporter [Endozoicomonas sp.]